jgi:hypothetical protein
MKRLFCLVLIGAFATPLSAETKILGWEDLTVNIEFEDPFTKLDSDQLMELSIYARIQRMIQNGQDVSDGMKQEMDKAEQTLQEQGVDIEGLLAKREEIAELRRKRAVAMDENLHGKTIRMPGYALALEYDGKKVKEFLLVPWVGACIHTPPPPPNQIVYVEASEAFDVRSRYEPVWIEGTLRVGEASKKLFLVDGSADIHIGYSMISAEIQPYRSAPKPVVHPANHVPNPGGRMSEG